MFNLEQAIMEWRQQMLNAGVRSPAPLDELENHLREEIERQGKLGLSEQDALEAASRRLGQPGTLQEEFSKVEGMNPWFREVFMPLGMIFLAFVVALNIFMGGEYAYEDSSSLKLVGLIDLLLLSLVLPLMSGSKPLKHVARSKTRARAVWTMQLLMGICGVVMLFSRDPGGVLIVVVSCLMFALSRRVQIRGAVALSIATAGLASALAARFLFWWPAAVYANSMEQMLGILGIGLGVVLLCSWPCSYRFLPVVGRKPLRRRIQTVVGALVIAGCVMFSDFISPFFNLRPDSQWMVALVWSIMVPLGLFGAVAFGLEEAARKRA